MKRKKKKKKKSDLITIQLFDKEGKPSLEFRTWLSDMSKDKK